MSYRFLLRASRFLAIVIVVLSLAATASAQVRATPRMTDQELLSLYEPAQISEFRNTFQRVLSADNELLNLMGKTEAARYLGDRAALIENMRDADVARLMATGVDLRPLMEATERLRQIVKEGRIEALRQIAPNSTGLPDADYSFCGSTRNAGEGMLAAQVVLEVAKGVWSAASRACDEVVVILGEGGNTSLLCIIVDVVLFAAETVFHGFQFCDNDIDSAEIEGSYDRLGHVHADLVAAETNLINQMNANTLVITTAIDASATAIINNDNANRTMIINNDNANRVMIINELRRIGCDIIRLLNTPEGQRSSDIAACEGQPGYPYDFPEKKITVTDIFPSLTEAVTVAPRSNSDN